MKPRQADQSEASEREREIQRAGVTDDADVHKPEKPRSSTCQVNPLTLYLTITLSGCQRPTDLVICKLYFEGVVGGEALTKEKEEMLDQDVISLYYQRRSNKCTHCLVFHAGENHIQHLGEGCFCCGLVDEVFTGQIDVVTRSHSL